MIANSLLEIASPKLGFLCFPCVNPLTSVKSGGFLRIKAMEDSHAMSVNGLPGSLLATVGKSTDIKWHECSVGKVERQNLLKQKGCVIWITGLSGSGKSTVAAAVSHTLYERGKLTYILDGDNVRHGLNSDLSFKAEDRAENIRRVGEVAKLFADSGVICITSLISPYKRDRDACRALLPGGEFIEVFMDVPLEVCEARDPKGLYKLARAGKIKGFTGIDDPYEAPSECENEWLKRTYTVNDLMIMKLLTPITVTCEIRPQIVLKYNGEICASPDEMAAEVISYLEERGYLHA